MLKLQLREIGPTLSDPGQHATGMPGVLPDDQNAWRDSSTDLEHGLDVVELSVDVLLCELQDAVSPPPPELLSCP